MGWMLAGGRDRGSTLPSPFAMARLALFLDLVLRLLLVLHMEFVLLPLTLRLHGRWSGPPAKQPALQPAVVLRISLRLLVDRGRLLTGPLLLLLGWLVWLCLLLRARRWPATVARLALFLDLVLRLLLALHMEIVSLPLQLLLHCCWIGPPAKQRALQPAVVLRISLRLLVSRGKLVIARVRLLRPLPFL
jgi:hypothetical protein